MPWYCELCGREITNEKDYRLVTVEGATLRVCLRCYSRLVKQGRVSPHSQATPTGRLEHQKSRRKRVAGAWSKARIPRRILEEEYEVVPDYWKRIREARQRLGWSTKVLAEKIREKENVVKRIEAGRLKPSIELARRLEQLLHIKLLEPIVEEPFTTSNTGEEDYFTIGDLIKIRSRKSENK